MQTSRDVARPVQWRAVAGLIALTAGALAAILAVTCIAWGAFLLVQWFRLRGLDPRHAMFGKQMAGEILGGVGLAIAGLAFIFIRIGRRLRRISN
jgi:hypothetical protein